VFRDSCLFQRKILIGNRLLVYFMQVNNVKFIITHIYHDHLCASNGTKLQQQDIKLKSGFSDLQAGFCVLEVTVMQTKTSVRSRRIFGGFLKKLGGGNFPLERPRINTGTDCV